MKEYGIHRCCQVPAAACDSQTKILHPAQETVTGTVACTLEEILDQTRSETEEESLVTLEEDLASLEERLALSYLRSSEDVCAGKCCWLILFLSVTRYLSATESCWKTKTLTYAEHPPVRTTSSLFAELL